jgi:hypothetical protein
MGVGMEENRGEGLELPRELANVVMSSMRQGLIIINDSREAEGIVQFFTAMIIDKDPLRVTDWRSEYITVNEGEFQEELKLLAMPLVHEMSVMRAIELPDGREYPVVMRKVYILLLASPVGLIIFGQPSIALIVNDTNKIYFGYKGIDVDTGGKVAVTIKAKVTDHMAIPFTPAIARFVFVGDVVEAMIDSNGQVKGLKR